MKPSMPFWRAVICALTCALLASGFAAARAQISAAAPRTWTLADMIHRSEAIATRMQAVPSMRPMANRALAGLRDLAAGVNAPEGGPSRAASAGGTRPGVAPAGQARPGVARHANAQPAGTGYSLTKSATIPAVSPEPVTVPLAGAPGQYAFAGSTGGGFGVATRAGKTVWTRDNYSLMTDLGIPQALRKNFGYSDTPGFIEGTYQPGITAPQSYGVWNPIYPLDPTQQGVSAQFVTGDLAGDGPGDVVVAVHVWTNLAGSPCPNTTAADCKPLLPGTSVIMGTFLVVLDGRTGATRWSKLFPGYLTHLLVRDKTLLVGNDTGDNATDPNPSNTAIGAGSGQPRSTSAVYAYRFTGTGTKLTARLAWSFNPGIPWLAWQSLTPADKGEVAIGYTATPFGTGQPYGHVRLVSTATGAPRWDVRTSGYPRLTQWDPVARDVVVLEEADPGTDLSYAVAGLRASNGSVARRSWHHGQIGMTLAVGDVTGNGHDQWVSTQISAADAVVDPTDNENHYYGSTSVTATDDQTGQTAWTTYLPNQVTASQSLAALSPRGLALVKAPGGTRVMVGAGLQTPLSADHPEGDGLTLGGFTGVLWSLRGHSGALGWHKVTEGTMNAGQVAVDPGGSADVLIGGGEPTLTSVNAQTGKTAAFIPLIGQMWAVASYDVNHDGTKDLIAGGNSHALFAFDGRHLNNTPRVLWHTILPGSVRQVTLARLTPQASPSLVVAATRAVDVVNPATGHITYQIGYAHDLVASVTVAPLRRGGPPGLVVPASTLAAYDGATGHLLWRYKPDVNNGHVFFIAAAVSKNGTVDTAYTGDAWAINGFDPNVNSTAAGISGSTGKVAWSYQPSDYADFNTVAPAGIVASPAIIGAAGNGVAISWNNWSNGPGQQLVDVRDADTGTPIWHQQVQVDSSPLTEQPALKPTPDGLIDLIGVTPDGGTVRSAIAVISPSGVTSHVDPQSTEPISGALATVGGQQVLIKSGWAFTSPAGLPGADYGITAYSLPAGGGTPQELASADVIGGDDLSVLGSVPAGGVMLAATPYQATQQLLVPFGDVAGGERNEVDMQIYTLRGPK